MQVVLQANDMFSLMKRNLQTALLCTFLLSSMGGQAQTTLLQDYVNKKSATIGTFQGIAFREAGFSSLYPIPNSNGKEFWTISDRGVNVDSKNANTADCRPTYDKMYAFPTYAPKIHRIRVAGDSIQILQTITMKRPDGTTATGLLNPSGFGSTSKEVNSIDTVLNCSNFLAKTVAKDIWGIDSEGLVVDADGNFWISEEGGPTIWKLNKNGVVVKRFTPYAHLEGAQPQDVQIDTVFKYRKNNRGFESLALTNSGKLYSIIQSPLLYPNKATGEATQVHRILEIDIKTNATRVFAYLNDGVVGTGADQVRLQDWKIGDMAAINDTTFLVIEAALRGATDLKKIYKINITGATPITAALYNGKTAEGLVDLAGLTANSIVPVKKTLFMDLNANGWPAALDKPEGLAIINDSTIAVGNDNDYGQKSPNEDGIAVATNNLSHVFVYGLKGNNKLKNVRPLSYPLAVGLTGPNSSQSPYLTAMAPEVKITSILTTTDSIKGYMLAGLPDGVGAYDNGDSTFTVLINHELGNTAGVVRAHGAKGAFVSKWVINKHNLSVLSGSDLIQKVKIWNPSTKAYQDSTYAFGRFCSADLAEPTAYFNEASGLGSKERIFMNGEETGNEGKGFANIVTGPEAGTSYELPALGKFSWENSVASPAPADKTIVAGMDDSTPGQIYFYVGNKTKTGSEIEKAGLTNGKLYGVKVDGFVTENSNLAALKDTAFTLFELGDVTTKTGTEINNQSNNAGVTTFLRPEDGAWDPKAPNDFYFVTTNAFSSPSRLWRLRFDDLNDPTKGGKIAAVLDGTEGQKMFDNMTIDNHGHALLTEDVGNNAHIGKIWEYNFASDKLTAIGQHDSTRFISGGANFLTQDEEASGILDVEHILGPGHFLVVDQAHYAIAGEAVEGGQLLSFFNPNTYKAAFGAGPSSSQAAYLQSTAEGNKFKAILTTTDKIDGYMLAGLPDGMGAYDNGNGTFTALVNHEIGNSAGVVRAHGAKGAFVSKWVINKKNMVVMSGSDLIQKVKIWDASTQTYADSAYAFGRFCSADLASPSAYYNANTALGSQARIFMNGEETGNEGKGFAHIVTGPEAGTSYELPALGKFSWENAVSCPTPADKTIVAGLDDSTPGQVYFYIGNKTNTGNEVEKAGLTNGKLYGVKVDNFITENDALATLVDTTFSLYDLGDVRNTSGTVINTNSNNNGVTTFLRPEDGAWDPKSPNDFYFVTTNAFASPSRLWKLNFEDIKHPEMGGRISAVLKGTEGQKMLDNMTIDNYGHALLTEDVGNNAHIGKIWQYNLKTSELKMVGQHDHSRFIAGSKNFLTQDEEASGIIDMEEILGPGYFILTDQAHYSIPGEAVEGGQLLSFFNNDTYLASELVSGIDDEDMTNAANGVTLYPNPTGDATTITMNLDKAQEMVITMVDAQGKMVMPAVQKAFGAGMQRYVLNTADLKDGLYFVQVASPTQTTRIKTVVSH